MGVIQQFAGDLIVPTETLKDFCIPQVGEVFGRRFDGNWYFDVKTNSKKYHVDFRKNDHGSYDITVTYDGQTEKVETGTSAGDKLQQICLQLTNPSQTVYPGYTALFLLIKEFGIEEKLE